MTTATKEKPIPFSGPMVRAILDGSKTQTRRPVKPQPAPTPTGFPSQHPDGSWGVYLDRPNAGSYSYIGKPRYQPGDVLWVRETWAYANSEGGPVVCYKANFDRRYLMDDVGFRCPDGSMNYDDPRLATADFSNWASDLESGAEGNWRPSIHLPRWAARLFLDVTGVRVERIQSISEADAKAEGVDAVPVAEVPRQATWNRRQDFMQLWEKQYPGSWARNDWVWVYEFKRIERM